MNKQLELLLKNKTLKVQNLMSKPDEYKIEYLRALALANRGEDFFFDLGDYLIDLPTAKKDQVVEKLKLTLREGEAVRGRGWLVNETFTEKKTYTKIKKLTKKEAKGIAKEIASIKTKDESNFLFLTFCEELCKKYSTEGRF